MHKTLTFAAAALSFSAFGTATAFNINDDIATCQDVIEETELMGDETYVLKFVDDEGNRNRVLTLEAVIVGKDDVMIECRMSRSKVKEVVIVEAE